MEDQRSGREMKEREKRDEQEKDYRGETVMQASNKRIKSKGLRWERWKDKKGDNWEGDKDKERQRESERDRERRERVFLLTTIISDGSKVMHSQPRLPPSCLPKL